jgi:hypothetical protein
MPFCLGYQDYLQNAVVSGGSWVTTLPLTNVQTDDLQEVARTASLSSSDTQFTADLGAPKGVGMIVVGPINASPDFQYRIRAYSDAALTLTKLDTGLTSITSGAVIDWTVPGDWLEWEDVNFWSGITPSELSDLPLYLVETVPEASPTDGQAQFWKFEFFDAGNSAGYLDIGGAMLFRMFRPELNYAPDSNNFNFEFLQDTNESKGGRVTFSETAIRRQARFSWPNVSEDSGFDDWMRIALLSRLSRRIFVLPEETDTGDRLRLRAFPATFKSTPALAQLNVARGSTAVDVIEVI